MSGQLATGLFVYEATKNYQLALAAFFAVFAICCMINNLGLILEEKK